MFSSELCTKSDCRRRGVLRLYRKRRDGNARQLWLNDGKPVSFHGKRDLFSLWQHGFAFQWYDVESWNHRDHNESRDNRLNFREWEQPGQFCNLGGERFSFVA